VSAPREPASHLLLPLRALVPPARPALGAPVDDGPAPRLVSRLLHLDRPADGGLAAWLVRVREAQEACLAVDAEGRVAAMSATCGRLLALDPVRTVGALLRELLVMVDFTAAGVPLADPHAEAPLLRALRSGTLTRGLIRLRCPKGSVRTYDVVGVPLAGASGALAFLTEV
jgi:hypothetical protein